MTVENVVADVAANPAAPLPVEAQTPEADKAAPAPAEAENADAADLAKEDAEASEAGKKLSERKQKNADRYRAMERAMHDATRRADALERRLAELEKVERPDPSKFTDVTEYDSANLRYQAAQLRKQDLAIERQDVEAQATAERQALYNETVAEFQRENPAFNPNAFIAAVQGSRFANDLADAIMDDPDSGVRVMDALAKNPAEARRIANLPPRLQLREIARMEVNLSQPAPKKITQAPEPIKPVTGSGTAKGKSLSDMSIAEYAAYVRKETGRS